MHYFIFDIRAQKTLKQFSLLTEEEIGERSIDKRGNEERKEIKNNGVERDKKYNEEDERKGVGQEAEEEEKKVLYFFSTPIKSREKLRKTRERKKRCSSR